MNFILSYALYHEIETFIIQLNRNRFPNFDNIFDSEMFIISNLLMNYCLQMSASFAFATNDICHFLKQVSRFVINHLLKNGLRNLNSIGV